MKGLRLYLVGSALIMILYLIAQYSKPQPTDWTATYLKEDKIPYGLYILHQEIAAIFPEAVIHPSRERIYNTLKNKNFSNTSYLLVAGSIKLDEPDYKELLKFMRAGNDVFIATYELGDVLSKNLKSDIGIRFDGLTPKAMPVRFTNPMLDSTRYYRLDKDFGHQYFKKLDTVRAISLGKNYRGQTNFVKYNFGKGALYLLPDPKLLTNINLLHPEGAAYVANALSQLPVSKTLIWDENNTLGDTADSSILRVIFAHQPLAWAYNLALFALVLFVIYEMKRRQRIIPVIAPLKNSSVEFVKVVGKVYYQQRDNRDIASKKITYLLEYIRTTYRLKTAKADMELATVLIARSGADEQTVNELFSLINLISSQNQVNDSQLINLNKLIEKFYKQVQ